MNRVLIIEDDAPYCELVESALRDDGFYAESAHTLASGLQKVSAGKPDAIVLDLSLPDSVREDTVAAVKSHYNGTIVVLSGSGDENTAKECIRKSASGFMNKEKGLKYLGTEIRNAIASFSKMRERQTAIQKLE